MISLDILSFLVLITDCSITLFHRISDSIPSVAIKKVACTLSFSKMGAA